MFSAAAPSASEAVQELEARLVPLATESSYGVIATVSINATGRLRNWSALRSVAGATARQEAFVLASAPYCQRSESIAAAIVLTATFVAFFP
jgi:hypothetical protein